MARIAGTDLPQKKRMEYALTYIYGIGLHTSRKILDATGISYDKRVHELTEDEVASIRNEIQDNYMVEGDLFLVDQQKVPAARYGHLGFKQRENGSVGYGEKSTGQGIKHISKARFAT